jgi:flagellar hook-associated protein 2
VTASYDASTDKITLTSSGGPITLGSGTDTSNFLQVAQLYNNNGGATNNTGTITSATALGRVNTLALMSSADLKTPITDGGSGKGEFKINGVNFTYDASANTIQDMLNNINESAAGVSASYDANNNRFVLANTTTGDVGISMQDVTGNFLAATGLSGGALSHGKNLLYTLNGGTQQLVSQSNIIAGSSSGIAGLSVTALATGSATVSVSPDVSTMSKDIQQFVTDYNTAQSYITSQQTVTTAADGTVTPGTLTGDTNTTGIVTSLRSLMAQVENIAGTSGTVTQLADLGFKSNGNDNTIALSDSSTLTSMLTSNLNDVKALFSDPTKGLATQMNTFITNTVGSTGTLSVRTADLTQQTKDLSTQISNLETKISNDSDQWNSQFSAMETAESQTNSELTYITQGVTNGSL